MAVLKTNMSTGLFRGSEQYSVLARWVSSRPGFEPEYSDLPGGLGQAGERVMRIAIIHVKCLIHSAQIKVMGGKLFFFPLIKNMDSVTVLEINFIRTELLNCLRLCLSCWVKLLCNE